MQQKKDCCRRSSPFCYRYFEYLSSMMIFASTVFSAESPLISFSAAVRYCFADTAASFALTLPF